MPVTRQPHAGGDDLVSRRDAFDDLDLGIPADADVAFMQGMLAHHQGAVEMSEVALKYAKDAEARDLATRVIAAQKAEIAEMQAWLKARGVQ